VDENARRGALRPIYWDMKLAGGLLASLQKGSSIVYEQAFVNNEVWLPPTWKRTLERVLLVKGFRAACDNATRTTNDST